MKQHITIKQLNELSEKKKGNLIEWWASHKFTTCEIYQESKNSIRFPLLSIGQMIQFLIEHNRFEDFHIYYEPQPKGHNWWLDHWGDMEKELCDVLWEAVKKILIKNALPL